MPIIKKQQKEVLRSCLNKNDRMEYKDIEVDSKLEKYLEKSIINMEKEFSINYFKKMLIEKISGHPKLYYDEKYLMLDKYITHKFAKSILFD